MKKITEEIRVSHAQMIQGIIARMSRASWNYKWWGDTFFLRQVRMLRGLYDTARKTQEDMQYNMDCRSYKASYVKVMFSITLFWFYAPMIVACGAIGVQ